ncbi:hypothetical protein WBJ53_06505 [Spirosoma sp. SC4-14]|uniref:hypothetical protein n=1 Tax=Spirosoma sp. SC4-14 TaxID=3128900 RepID=UPI0030CB2478
MQPNLQYLTANPPTGLAIGFALTTALTLLGFMMAVRQAAPRISGIILIGLIAWLFVLGTLASQGFFTTLNTKPPRLFLAVGPPLLLIAGLFVSRSGRRFLAGLPLSTITYLHTIRIVVELVLYGLYVNHQIPELMTFEGRNFDILAGLTAPILAYFSFNRPILSKRWLFVWNIAALLLLINIIIHAILSAPSPFQQLAFEQPNVGILKFPFIWLPGFVVPVVLLCHLVVLCLNRDLYDFAD